TPSITPPLIAFEPLPDPNMPDSVTHSGDGSESEGISGFAPAPALFPAGLNPGVFAGFDGTDDYGVANEENPLIFADPKSGHYFDFVSNEDPYVGHLDGATTTAGALFLSYISSGYGDGRIYQIQALQPVLAPIGNQSVQPGSTLSLTASAQ